MTSLEIIKNDFKSNHLNKQFRNDQDDDFRKVLKDRFYKIECFVNKEGEAVSETHLEKATIDNYVRVIQLIIDKLTKSIDYYYNGRPDKAYLLFEESLDEAKIHDVVPKNRYTKNDNFYRIRQGTNWSKREDIFHIPYDKRTLIATQRYSIAGFPCLYLSNSVYTAWQELNRPKIEGLSFAMLTPKQTALHFIDMSLYNFKKRVEKSLDLASFLKELILYPILLSCSVKVAKTENPFKPEYIFSQFMTIWCKSEGMHGIMYDSTRIHERSEGVFFNFALPVDDIPNTTHCLKLTKMLILTAPFQWKNEGNKKATFSGNKEISKIFSEDVAKVILFEKSVFAKIETYLQGQDTGTL
jgi:hypothetical protein